MRQLWTVLFFSRSVLAYSFDTIVTDALTADDACEAADGVLEACASQMLQTSAVSRTVDSQRTDDTDVEQWGIGMGNLETEVQCMWSGCPSYLGKTKCYHLRCICDQGTIFNEVNNRCESPSSRGNSMDTGGSCRFLSCSRSRGATRCLNHRCVCFRGYRAVKGKCVDKHSVPATPASGDDAPEPPPSQQACGKANGPCTSCCAAGYICQTSKCVAVTSNTVISAYAFPTTLRASSTAPLIEYYVYRAQPDAHYPLENVNVGNLPGLMWYLSNYIVASSYGRHKLGITHIVRYKVWSRATAPLYELGLNYGSLFAFDAGQCVGPFSCDVDWKKYGYVVGCTNMNSSAYLNGIMYSFPGKCPQMTDTEKKGSQGVTCIRNQHGGHCSGAPTGEAACTYTYEHAGTISIDDLTGYKAGDTEYDPSTDKGKGMAFWDGLHDPVKAAERIKKVSAMFDSRYPGTVSNVTNANQGQPGCDANDDYFYGRTTPPACKTAVAGDACAQELAWAKSDGINAHPEWYPGLTPSSSDFEFQMVASKSGSPSEACARPCKS